MRKITIGTVLIFISAAFLRGGPSLAAQDFIQTYLEANGGCGRGNVLSWVLVGAGRQAPFDKPAQNWTDADLEALSTGISKCVDATARAGNPYDLADASRDAKRILIEIPQIVSYARGTQNAKDRQIAARKRMAEERIRAAKMAELNQKSDDENDVARLEREALQAEQKLAAARNQRELANLQKKQSAERAKAETDRQQEAAIRNEQNKTAALEADRQHREFLTSRNLTETTVLDLQSRGRELENKQVAVTGYVRVFNEKNVAIYSGPHELSGVPLDMSTASADTRRKIFANCGSLDHDCKIEIAGIVGFADHVFLFVQ